MANRGFTDSTGKNKLSYTFGSATGQLDIGGKISGNNVLIAAKNTDALAISTINLTGVVDTQNLSVYASKDVNVSGTVIGYPDSNDVDSLLVNMNAGRDVNLASTTNIYGDSPFNNPAAKNETDVTITAGRDANLSGYIIGDGTYNGGQGISVAAGRNINADKNLDMTAQGGLFGGAYGGVALTAQNNINIDGFIHGDNETSGPGGVTIKAGNNINTGSDAYINSDSSISLSTTKGDINLDQQQLYTQGTLDVNSGRNLNVGGSVEASYWVENTASPTFTSAGNTVISGSITTSEGLNVKAGGNVDLSNANINANAVTYYPYGDYGINNKDITNVNITAKGTYTDNAATKIATSGDDGGKINITATGKAQFNGTYTADSYQNQLSTTPSPAGSISLKGAKGSVYKGDAYTLDANNVADNNVSVYYGNAAHTITGNGDIASQLPAKY